MSLTCKVLVDTVFKTQPIDSSELSPTEVTRVSKGTEYPIASWKLHDQHILITLGKDGAGKQVNINGHNTWYVFLDHVQFNPSIAANESERKPFAPNAPVVWSNMNSKVSKYFTVREVTNGDPRRIPDSGAVEQNILKLATELDKIREVWGSSIGVTSWNRPPAINRSVGGVSNSQHIYGSAVDIYTMDGRDHEFEKWLDRNWGGGLGYGVASGRFFTHLDMRGGGWKYGSGSIRWMY